MRIIKTLPLFVSVVSICSMQAMKLDELPSECVSNLIRQLIASVQAVVLNTRDIPVIAYGIKALSLTNKSLYYTVNNAGITYKLVNALAEQCDLTLVNALGEINTPGAREYLKQYLQETGEYESFKLMQQIFKIADEISEEFEQLDVRLENYQKDGLDHPQHMAIRQIRDFSSVRIQQ